MKHLVLALAAILLAAPAAAQSEGPLVLTSVGPVFQAAGVLLDGTGVSVRNVPETPRPLDALPPFFARQRGQFAELFRQAEAVAGIGRIWPPDPLYPAAREANIRVVPIDASQPWSLDFSGVAVAESPITGNTAPWFWTAPSNYLRMLDILARDLSALFPEQAPTISANLSGERGYYLNLRADFETRLLEAADPAVYALAEEFVYLFRDLGIFVEGWFVKQDIDWTEEDYRNLTASLRENGTQVVVHKWEPSEEIRAAIAAAGARLVVLDMAETATSGFRESMAGNLEKLVEALLAPGGE